MPDDSNLMLGENFVKAYNMTMNLEGLYGNNPNDHGKETYAGISRKFWPDWKGWIIIDQAKQEPDFPKNLKDNKQLSYRVKEFYFMNFWLANHCNDVGKVDLSVAIELFDTSVNMGLKPAAQILQRTVNLLNYNQKLFNDISVDGLIGKQTINALQKVLSKDKSSDNIFKWMNLLQGSRYADLMEHDKTQEYNARGWLKRIQLYKNPMDT